MSISFIKLSDDHELGSETSLSRTISSSSTSVTTSNLESNYSLIPDEDFRVYEGGDVTKFFSQESPQTVSDTCLVNDFFILVKMPNACWKKQTDTEEIIREEESNDNQLSELPTKISKTLSKNARLKLSRYFNCKRCRRISPVHEESLESKDFNKKLPGGNVLWSHEENKVLQQEESFIPGQVPITERVFEPTCQSLNASKRNEIINIQKPISLTANNVNQKPSENRSIESTTTNDHVNIAKTPKPFNASSSVQERESQLNSISSKETPIKLEHYGYLKKPNTPEAVAESSESNLSKYLFGPNKAEQDTKFQVKALHWLLKSVRTGSKSEKITCKRKKQAVICKTYFVRWIKPPETLWHGYGINPNLLKTKCDDVLYPIRRCRSATF